MSATVFREGHDAVGCNLAARRPDGSRTFVRMTAGAPGTDRWSAPLPIDAEGKWTFTVEAWSDPLGTWWHDAPLKVAAGVDVDVVLEEGAQLFERAAKGVPAAHRTEVAALPALLRDPTRDPSERVRAATGAALVALLSDFPIRELVTKGEPR